MTREFHLLSDQNKNQHRFTNKTPKQIQASYKTNFIRDFNIPADASEIVKLLET